MRNEQQEHDKSNKRKSSRVALTNKILNTLPSSTATASATASATANASAKAKATASSSSNGRGRGRGRGRSNNSAPDIDLQASKRPKLR